MASQLPVQHAAPRFRLLLLGPFAVYRDGIALDTAAWQPAVSTLLRLLATAPSWRRSRDEVMDLLWPDASPEAAASNLRSKLHLLRRALGEGEPWPVLFERGWIELNRAFRWEIDLDRFEELLRTAGEDAGKLEEAVALYRGEPLAEDRYQDWALPVRERVQRLWHGGVLSLTQQLEQRRQYDAALGRVELLLDQDPLDEDAVRALVRLLGLTGRRTEATRRFRQFEQRLRQELDLAPEPETVAALEQIKQLPDRSEHPAAAPESGPPTNLRAPLTSFVGREREVKIIQRLLERPEVRLLTLTGTGGTGKTRLALQVGETMLASFPDGVFFVALESVKNPELVVSTVVRALDVREVSGKSLPDTLADHLRDKRLLLILDNFEHVLDAGPMVVELAEQCPQLRILVTSRAPLHVYGEHEFPVPALTAPSPERLPNTEVLAYVEAVALFLERARAVQPDFALTEESAPAIAAICHRLEGLPLAIELAAARIKHFPPRELRERVERRLPFLTEGPRNRPERLRSVRGMIDWSYDLLDQPDQRLFARLSVFAGGCTLEAAAAVCNGDLGGDLRAALTRLVDANLLMVEQIEPPGARAEPRFSQLETIREYGIERLAADGDAEGVRSRHAQYYVAVAERAEPELQASRQAAWMEHLDRDVGNLRQALQWALDRQDAEFGLRLATSLSRFWSYRDHVEGQQWIDRLFLLAGEEGETSSLASLRAKALYGASRLANWHGDLAKTEELAGKSLALYRDLGDRAGMADALSALGSAAIDRNECRRAATLLEESLSLLRELGDEKGIAYRLNQLGLVAARQGDYERAMSLYRESLAMHRELGDTLRAALTLGHLGVTALVAGDLASARSAIEESLELRQQTGDTWGVAFCMDVLALAAWAEGSYEAAARLAEDTLPLWREVGDPRGITAGLETLGRVVLERGELDRATALYRECLTLSHRIDDKQQLAYALEGMGKILSEQGKLVPAARLFGASSALRNRCDAPIKPFERASYERAVASIRRALGDHAFASSWKQGEAMALDEAIAFPLEV